MANAPPDPSNMTGAEEIRTAKSPSNGITQPLVWRWLAANTLGFAIATPLSFIANLSAHYFEALYLAGFIVGAVVGPLQALVIRQQLPRLRLWQWVLANILGSYLGSWLGLLVFGIVVIMIQWVQNLPDPGELVTLLLTIGVYSAVIGIVVSIAQVLSLSNHAQNLRQWWLANFLGRLLGWMSASLVGWGIFNVTGAENFLVTWGALLGAVGGAVYALVTTRALLALAHTP